MKQQKPRNRPFFWPGAILAALLVTPFAAAQESRPDLMPADEILARARRAFPDDPLELKGILQAQHNRRRNRTSKYYFTMLMEWKADVPRVTLVLRDAFGTDREKIEIQWRGQGLTDFTYFKGANLEPAQIPDLFVPIADMGFNWADLSLSFLWWSDGKTLDVDKHKDRPCYVLLVPAPSGNMAFDKVKLWIDAEVFSLLRAEYLDKNGEPVKKFKVISVTPVNKMWIIKQAEFRNYSEDIKARIKVSDMTIRDPDEEP